jgi:HPt (histidine-containing phosphotransfer) domain-containing protein
VLLPIFDRAVLDRLAAQASGHGDHGLVAEILEDALSSISVCTRDLEAALAARDRDRIRAAAHRVKSVLRQMGALRMGHEAAEAERLALAGDEGVFDHARETLALHAETAVALRAHLATLRG